jgi:hypothetical protein
MQRTTRWSAALAAVALCAGLAGCGSGHSAAKAPTVTAAPRPTSTAVIPPVDYPDPFTGARDAAGRMPAFAQSLATGLAAAAHTSGDPGSRAADVRARLTQLLVEHVYLEGMLAAAVNFKGEKDALSKAAVGAVDANAKALAKVLTALGESPSDAPSPAPVATPAATDDSSDDNSERTSTDFLTAWRAHDGDLLDFAVAARERIKADEDHLRDNLGDWSQATSHALKSMAGGNLRSTDVRYALDKYTDALTDAMESLAKQNDKGYDQLRKAAANVETVAATLARGFTRGDKGNGNSDDDASALRGRETYLLTEHVWLADTAVLAGWTHIKDGAESSPDAKAAALALDDNSKDLAASLSDVASPRQQFLFLTGWRTHVNAVLDYAAAVRAADTSRADAQVAALDAYRTTAGSFLAAITDQKLTAATVAAALSDHIAALTGSIQALAAALLAAAGT